MTTATTETPSPEDLDRAIELSNKCVLASRVSGGPVPYYFTKDDLLLISAALRSFVVVWGGTERRKEIEEFLDIAEEKKPPQGGYKIIHTDNFGSDYPDERFLSAESPDSGRSFVRDIKWTTDPDKAQVWADNPQSICDRINAVWGEDHLRFCKVVPADYVLKPGFEP